MKIGLIAISIAPLLCAQNPEAALRRALAAKTGTITLPSGTIEITREILLAPDAHDLEIKGSKTTIRAADSFRGRALLGIPGGRNIRIHDITFDGNREAVGHLGTLPPSGTMLSRFVADNGIVAEGVTGLEIGPLTAIKIAGFAVLINASHNVRIHQVDVTESGGFGPQRKNNATGGIAIEEETADFRIERCLFGTIRGTAVTVRRSERGQIAQNEFRAIARDAIHVNHGTGITIVNNHAEQIGIPLEEVDAIGSLCMRLEQFQSGEVSGNTCSEALLGAMTISGSANKIMGNHFTGLNLSRRDTPGVYLASGAKEITVEANEISGNGMSLHCVGAAPDVNKNDFRAVKNDCSDEASVAGDAFGLAVHAGLLPASLATRETAFTSFRHGILSQSSTNNISPSRHEE